MDVTNATVVILGGGLTGLATAVYLAREGIDDVIVVERDAHPWDPARSLEPVEPGVLEHAHRTDRALGRDRFAALLAFLDRNRELAAADGWLDPVGVSWWARDPREADDVLASAALHRALDQEVVHRREPFPTSAGYTLPRWGRLQPDATARLEAAATAAGVRVLRGAVGYLEQVEPVVVSAGDVRVEAEVAVLTAGFGCSALHERLTGSLTPIREAALRVEGTCPPGVHRTGHGWTLWTPRDDHTLVSGCRWATPHMEVGETDPRPHPRVLGRLEAFARDTLGLTGPIQDRWAWIAADTRDHLPLVGPLPGQPRVLVATGFASNPASWAFAAARSVVDGLVDGRTTTPEMLRTQRLVRWSR
jgi:glycine/D-amino acid oxidase-like deaminating enzyme